MQVLHVQVPLHVLNPVYGKSVGCTDSIRVALLRRTVVQNRPVWSSWQYLTDQEGSPWCPSAFGTLPVDSETDQDFSLPEEPMTSKTFRLAANQMRREFRQYLDDSKLQERTVNWYDQLGQFPEFNPKWLVLDSPGPSHSSSSSLRLPKEGWIGLPFSLHARFAEEGTTQRAWKIELTREDRSAGSWVMEWLGQGSFGVIRWKLPSGAAGKTEVREAIVSFSPTTHPNREPRDVVMTYRGTANLLDLDVYLDGARAAVSVLESPAPWEFTDGAQGSWESQVDWKLSISGSAVESLQVYRASLTPIEALGLIPDAPFVSWSEWRPEDQRLWIEHFAEREDRDGGYLLESLLHYSESAMRAAKGNNASNSKVDNHK
ncbi:hypothetical protein [Pirellula sp. SH-Sr6A]|uniref:hypothetical protein n=1 Tax=Pirellula sp. SH-Sr6A TaxID=1632865 RepID=UPI00197C8C5C|nr:hypothetical protein [Pirellula sp. SH-Sr6A]